MADVYAVYKLYQHLNAKKEHATNKDDMKLIMLKATHLTKTHFMSVILVGILLILVWVTSLFGYYDMLTCPMNKNVTIGLIGVSLIFPIIVPLYVAVNFLVRYSKGDIDKCKDFLNAWNNSTTNVANNAKSLSENML